MPGLKNVGRLDCVVRVLLGVWLTVHGIGATDRPFLAIAWTALGLFVLGTGLLRVCPLYTLVRALHPRKAGPAATHHRQDSPPKSTAGAVSAPAPSPVSFASLREPALRP